MIAENLVKKDGTDIKCNSREVAENARESLHRQEPLAQNISIYVVPVRNDQVHQASDVYLKMFIFRCT